MDDDRLGRVDGHLSGFLRRTGQDDEPTEATASTGILAPVTKRPIAVTRSLTLHIHQLSQHCLEADAALAGQCGGFADRALAVIRSGKTDADFMAAEQRPVAF